MGWAVGGIVFGRVADRIGRTRIRLFVKEPERWKSVAEVAAPPRLSELFTPAYRSITVSGFLMALVALVTWWSCNAFLPVVASGLAAQASAGLSRVQATELTETWKVPGGQHVHAWRADRHAADDPRVQDFRAPPDVHHVLRAVGRVGAGALHVLFFVGFVPLAGLLVMPWVLETKGRALAD